MLVTQLARLTKKLDEMVVMQATLPVDEFSRRRLCRRSRRRRTLHRGYLAHWATARCRRARHLLKPPRKGERRAPRARAGAASAATRGRRLGGAARVPVLCAVAHEHLGPADESTGDATRYGDIDGYERRAQA